MTDTETHANTERLLVTAVYHEKESSRLFAARRLVARITELEQQLDKQVPDGWTVVPPARWKELRAAEARVDTAYDEGREAVLGAFVCSVCGLNHDADESAACDGCEPMRFDEWAAPIGARVAELTKALQEIAAKESWVQASPLIAIARAALAAPEDTRE